MLFSFLLSVGRFYMLNEFGLRSIEYKYFYYYSDAVLTIFLYLALITLYLNVFDDMKVEKFVRLAAVLLLAGTALFSTKSFTNPSTRCSPASYTSFRRIFISSDLC